jgi:hypothetical protein
VSLLIQAIPQAGMCPAALIVRKDAGLGEGLDGVVDDIGGRFARKSKKAEELPKV